MPLNNSDPVSSHIQRNRAFTLVALSLHRLQHYSCNPTTHIISEGREGKGRMQHSQAPAGQHGCAHECAVCESLAHPLAPKEKEK